MLREKCINLLIGRKESCEKKLSEVKFIVIDKMSLVSSVLFYQMHQKLSKIFGCSTELPFEG